MSVFSFRSLGIFGFFFRRSAPTRQGRGLSFRSLGIARARSSRSHVRSTASPTAFTRSSWGGSAAHAPSRSSSRRSGRSQKPRRGWFGRQAHNRKAVQLSGGEALETRKVLAATGSPSSPPFWAGDNYLNIAENTAGFQVQVPSAGVTGTTTASDAWVRFTAGSPPSPAGAWSSLLTSATPTVTVKVPNSLNGQSGTFTSTIEDTAVAGPSAASATLTIDLTSPTIQATSFTLSPITPTAPLTAFKAGQAFSITATTSEPVKAGGSITAVLSSGGSVTLTATVAGSSLTGTYTVLAGENTPDLAISSWNTSTLVDVADNPVIATNAPTGSFTILGTPPAAPTLIIIDTAQPTIVSVSPPTATTYFTASLATLNFDVTFTEPVSGLTPTGPTTVGGVTTTTTAYINALFGPNGAGVSRRFVTTGVPIFGSTYRFSYTLTASDPFDVDGVQFDPEFKKDTTTSGLLGGPGGIPVTTTTTTTLDGDVLDIAGNQLPSIATSTPAMQGAANSNGTPNPFTPSPGNTLVTISNLNIIANPVDHIEITTPSPSPRVEPVDVIKVRFVDVIGNKAPVVFTTGTGGQGVVDLNDFVLRRNGEVVPWIPSGSTTPIAELTWSQNPSDPWYQAETEIRNLSGYTKLTGEYTLTFSDRSISPTTWNVARGVTGTVVPATPSKVTGLSNLSGLVAGMTLTKTSGSGSFGGGGTTATITSVDKTNKSIEFTSTVGLPGAGQVTFDASIVSPIKWTMTYQMPGELTATLTALPAPIGGGFFYTTPVDSVKVEFQTTNPGSGAITKVDVKNVDTVSAGTAIKQFVLYKDGAIVSFTPGVRVTGSGSTYYVTGLADLTKDAGTYDLLVLPNALPNAPIETLADAPMIASTGVSWQYTNTQITDVTVSDPALTSPPVWRKLNDSVTLKVKFDTKVNVDTSSGVPRIQVLLTSAAPAFANYVSGTGTDTLTFRYRVAGGDEAPYGIVFGTSIDPNGGSIQNSAGQGVALLFTPPDSSGAKILVDGVAPVVQGPVDMPVAGVSVTGDKLTFTVNFSEPVDVVTTGGTPKLTFTIGGIIKQASYKTGTGSTALVFEYTILGADSGKGIVATGLVLAGGTIKDKAGNDATLTGITGSSPNASVNLVGIAASGVTVSSSPGTSGIYKTGSVIEYSVKFTKAVNVLLNGGTAQIKVVVNTTSGSRIANADYFSGSGTDTLKFRWTVQQGDLDTDGVDFNGPTEVILGGTTIATIKDASGTDALLAFAPPTTPTVLVDAVAPVVQGPVDMPVAGVYSTVDKFLFTVNFSEPVRVAGSPKLNFTIGGSVRQATLTGDSSSQAGSTSGIDYLVFEYEIKAADLGSGVAATGIALAGATIKDIAGNDATLTPISGSTNAAVNVVGIVANGVSVSSIPGSSGVYKTGSVIEYSVTFSKPVTVALNGGTVQLPLIVDSANLNPESADYISGSGTSTLKFRYIVRAGDLDTDGVLFSSTAIALGGNARIQDLTGTAVTALDFAPPTTVVRVDAVAPTVLNVDMPVAGVYTDSLPDRLAFTVRFSEPVSLTSGSPVLIFTIGGITKQAGLTPASIAAGLAAGGTMSLTFEYAIGATDLGVGIVATGVALSGGTLRDLAGNDATTQAVLPITGSSPNASVNEVGIKTSGVAVPAGFYKAGDYIYYTATFSKPVRIGSQSSAPSIPIIVGSNPRSADYYSGNNTAVLTFRYLVVPGDNDDNGVAFAGTSVNPGLSIKDLNGNNALVDFVPPATAGVIVDTQTPSLLSITLPTAGSYRQTKELLFRVPVDEAVTVLGLPQLSFTYGSPAQSRVAAYNLGLSSSTTLVFTYPVLAIDPDGVGVTATGILLNGGSIKDDAGNAANLTTFTPATSSGVVIDNTAPVATLQSVSPTVPNGVGPSTLTFTLSEAVVGFGATSMTATNGFAVGLPTPAIQPLTFTAPLSPSTTPYDGFITVAIPANSYQDVAGNWNAAQTFSVRVDTVKPSVTLAGTAVININNPMAAIFAQFSEVPSPIPALNVVQATPGLIAGNPPMLVGSGITYQSSFAVNPGKEGTVLISIDAGSYSDAAGNPGLTSGTLTLRIDTLAPTVTDVTATTVNGAYNAGATISIAVSFSEAVTVVSGTPTLRLNSAANAFAKWNGSGSGTNTLTFDYNVAPGDNAADLDYATTGALALGGATIRDAFGNDASLVLPATGQSGSLGWNANIRIDTLAPTVAIVASPTSLTGDQTSTVTFTTSADVLPSILDGKSLPTGSVAGGTLTPLSYTGTPATYTATFKPDMNATAPGSIRVPAGFFFDGAGNANDLTVMTPAIVHVPTVQSITTTKPAGQYTVGETILLTVVFDEKVTFSGTSPRLGMNVGTSRFATYDSGNGTESLTFKYMVQSGDNTAALDAVSLLGTLRNTAGATAVNTLPLTPLSEQKTIVIDTLAPSVASVTYRNTVSGTYGVGQKVRLQVTFTEPVTVATGIPSLRLNSGSTALANWNGVGSGTKTLVFVYTIKAGENTPKLDYVPGGLTGVIRDLTGNAANLALATPSVPGSLGASGAVVVDTQAPSLLPITLPPSGTYRQTKQLQFRVPVSEPVAVIGLPQLTFTYGSPAQPRVAAYAAGLSSPTTLVFTYTVLATDPDGVGVTATGISLNGGSIKDVVGNQANLATFVPVTSSSVVINPLIRASTSPALGTTPGTAPSYATSLTKIVFTFNTPVTGMTMNAIKLFFEGRSVSTTGATLTGSGTTYTLTLPSNLTSLKGLYRLRIGGSQSGITAADGTPLEPALNYYWRRV